MQHPWPRFTFRTPGFLSAGLLSVALGLAAGCDIASPTSGESLGDGTLTRVTMGQSGTSAFIVEQGNGRFALIDTGEAAVEGETDPLLTFLAEKGGGVEDVDHIFFTHGHGDHIGGAPQFTSASLHSLQADVGLIEGREAPERPLPSGEPELTGLTVDDPVVDEEVLVLGDRRITVFAVPGHTAGSAAYLVDRTLLLGDTCASTSQGELGGATWIFSKDTAENDASLAALVARIDELGLEVDTLAPAHSATLGEGLEPLRRYVASLP